MEFPNFHIVWTILHNHNKSHTEQLATTKTYFNEMIMIETKGPIKSPSEGNQYIFVIVDAFSHFVTLMCAPKKRPLRIQCTF